GDPRRPAMPLERPRLRLSQILGPFVGLFLVLLLFGVLEPDRFLDASNLKTVATQTVIVALGAIGMTFVVVSGGIDLSAGSSIALATVVVARLLRSGACPLLPAARGALVERPHRE